jgi:hypothetical protein
MSYIKMKKNSLTHDILMISKVLSKRMTIDDLHNIHESKYKNLTKVNRSLLYLNFHNLIYLYDDNSWIITPLGKLFLYDIVQRNPQTTSS